MSISYGNAVARDAAMSSSVARSAAARHGRMANARAGKPKPFLTLGQVTT
jgi:hypothetical protein